MWGWPGSGGREKAAAHTTPTACKTPTLAVCVPRWTRAARTEGARKGKGRPSRPGLACRCSQRQGLFPLEMEVVGVGESQEGHGHIINTYTHSLSPFQHPDYVNLLTPSSHLGSLSAPTHSHSSRHGHPAFLRPVWERGRLEIRGQAESEQRQAGTGQANQTRSGPAF